MVWPFNRTLAQILTLALLETQQKVYDLGKVEIVVGNVARQ